MAQTYYLPRRFEMTSAWSAYIRVTDAATGQVLDKIDTVDMDAGTVEFQHWNEATGGYAPRLEKREVALSIAAGAPKAALEWWSLPIGDDKHVEVTR